MKLLGNNKSKITKDKNSENVPRLEITELVLVYCNIINIDYQQDTRVSHTFTSNKSFCQLLDNSPEKIMFLKIFNSEFPYIEIWLLIKILELENETNTTLVFLIKV